MSRTRPGGRQHRAWRLKKKRDKWFRGVMRDLVRVTLEEIPGFFDPMFDAQDYDFMRLYK